MNFSLSGLALQRAYGKSPFLQFSPTTFSRKLNFKNFNFNFFAGKFVQNTGKGKLGVYKSKFSRFNGGVIKYSRETFTEGSKQYSVSTELNVANTYFSYMDTEIVEEDEKAQQVIYSTVLTKISECFFFECLCYTEGSVIYINQAGEFNASTYIDDKYDHSNIVYLYDNSCKDIVSSTTDIKTTIKFGDSCTQITHTTSSIEKCAFRKIVSRVNSSLTEKGWGVSLSSGECSVKTSNFVNIVDTDWSKENLFMSVNTVFRALGMGESYTNDLHYLNYTGCNSRASGIAVVSNPAEMTINIGYVKLANGTTKRGCIQIYYTVASDNVGTTATTATNILFLRLQPSDASSYSSVFIFSGTLTLKDSTFYECSRAIGYQGENNPLTISGCKCDSSSFSSFLNGKEAASKVTVDKNIQPDNFDFGESFSQIPVIIDVKNIFKTQEFTPTPGPTDLPTAIDEYTKAPEIIGVGVWTSIAGVIIFFYFVFTVYLRFGQKRKFNVIGRIEDVEVSSDSGALAFICNKIKCQNSDSDSSSSSIESSEDIEKKKHGESHVRSSRGRFSDNKSSRGMRTQEQSGSSEDEPRQSQRQQNSRSEDIERQGASRGRSIDNKSSRSMKPQKQSSSSSSSSEDEKSSSEDKPRQSQRQQNSRRPMNNPQPVKQRGRFSSSSSYSESSEPKSKRKASESSDSSY